MSTLYYRIEKLCKAAGITITTMCKASGASRASLSDLKMGRKQGLSTDTLSKIADELGVSVGLLIGEKPEWEDAIDTFGFCWNALYREKKKTDARAIVNDPSIELDKKVDAQITVFKALFSRSLEASGYDLDHVDFPTYISMVLWQGSGKHNIPVDVYDQLVETYGTKPGIPQGTYYAQKEKAPAESGKRSVSDEDIKFALFGGSGDITDAMYQEVKEFAALIKLREDMKKAKE